ncbi:MAG: hypothetical protein LIR50_00805 [Bacillota bacterium]|nr:hypothetical protein [Bacillota bacterium]
MIRNNKTTHYDQNIKYAATALHSKNYPAAEKYLLYAMLENSDAPEAQNLFGALSELTGDLCQAEKHYLAANALDPTYKPAIVNLERVTSINYVTEKTSPCLGDK